MREDRLNALMLLFVHKGISPDHGKVIDKSATRHSRRMLLVDPVSSDWTFFNHTYLMIIHISIISITYFNHTYFNHKYLMIIHISIIHIFSRYLDLDLLPRLTRPYLQMLCTCITRHILQSHNGLEHIFVPCWRGGNWGFHCLKTLKFQNFSGRCPEPRWGAHSAPHTNPTPPAGFVLCPPVTWILDPPLSRAVTVSKCQKKKPLEPEG